MKEKEKPRPYNTLPRFLAEDYLDKKLTRSELILLLWLRSIADIFGVTTTSASTLRDDMFPGVEVNTVEKLLLSVKKKGYVDYPNHQGRRGSIRIQSDEWLIRGKGVLRITKLPNPSEVISVPQITGESGAEVNHKLNDENQKFLEQKNQLAQRFSIIPTDYAITSHHNEHEHENKKENDTSGSTFKGTLVSEFNPTNGEERRLKVVALEIGEECINPLLNELRKPRGMWVIEKAFQIYEQDKKDGKRISSPPAYLMGVIKKIRAKI